MEFTTDWTVGLQANVCDFLVSEYGACPCSLLEVGIFEGRSAHIFFDKLLTHPDSRYTGIDDWWSPVTALLPPIRTGEWPNRHKKFVIDQAEFQRRAMANFDEFPAGKWRIIETYSHAALLQLHQEKATFDIVYVDGDHTFGPCLLDSILAWPLTKDILLWDDAAPHWEVTVAIQHFLSLIPGQYTVMFWPSRRRDNYQLAIRKNPGVGHKFVESIEFLPQIKLL